MKRNLQQKYIDQLFEELNLSKLIPEEKEKSLAMLQERFSKVVMVTMLRLMNEEQRQRFKAVINQPEKLEEESEKIASEIPSLDEVLEVALDAEYKIIKQAME